MIFVKWYLQRPLQPAEVLMLQAVMHKYPGKFRSETSRATSSELLTSSRF